MKIINLFGGPGTGKSTTAAHLFSLLKRDGCNVELVTEYAKDLCWDKSYEKLQHSLYVFARQAHRLWRCENSGVDVVVTDSPILLAYVYQNKYSSISERTLLDEQIRATIDQYNNFNFFLKREKEYVPLGRNQTEKQAKSLDKIIKESIPIFGTDIISDIKCDEDAASKIFEQFKYLSFPKDSSKS